MKSPKQELERHFALVEKVESSYVADTPLEARRESGTTFTPQWVVDLMLRRIKTSRFSTIIDTGAGLGRFALSAAQRFPKARIVAVENNPFFASELRAVARTSGSSDRVRVVQGDFLDCPLPRTGPRLFLGNPPYVRHHSLTEQQKNWLYEASTRLGRPLSGLSGLHIYFLARILTEAAPGDSLLMILPSEWLETKYGNAIKASMLARCQKIRLLLFDASTRIFADAMTTSVILQLKFGGSTRVLDVVAVDDGLGAVQRQAKVMLPPSDADSMNWLSLASNALNPTARRPASSKQMIELGELFAIHRGQVTGKNAVWIANSDATAVIPEQFLYPCITDAKEILQVQGGVLESTESLRKVIDLPADLSVLPSDDREHIDAFLGRAKAAGAADGYIAKHRKPWWRVGLRNPPAVIMTYMARRAPRFVLNRAGARLINIAHGLYPRRDLTESQLLAIVRWLNGNPLGQHGRTYAGGLIKLEPGDASRIKIPDPSLFEIAA